MEVVGLTTAGKILSGNLDGTTPQINSFSEDLKNWVNEGADLNENRQDAANILQEEYANPDPDFFLNFSGPEFNYISSFATLSLEKHFPHVTDIDFSNCTALTDLPEALFAHVVWIDITNCPKLQLFPPSLSDNLVIKGFVPGNLSQYIADQWKSDPASLFNFEDKFALLENCGLAVVHDAAQFFLFSYPGKLTDPNQTGVNSLGWKLHVSVDPLWVEEAFKLVATIVCEYKLCFKVVNTNYVAAKPDEELSERFCQGAQITIYLEDEGKQAISADDLSLMIARINQALVDSGIAAGVKPQSDATIIGSDFCTIRNDRCTVQLKNNLPIYLCADDIGSHFNPANNLNPFAKLLTQGAKQITPRDLLQTSAGEVDIDSEVQFVALINACFTEFTHVDRENRQWCMKEEYKANSKMNKIARQAAAILDVLDERTPCWSKKFHWQINSLRLSEDYPFNDNYKKMLLGQEARSKVVFDDVFMRTV